MSDSRTLKLDLVALALLALTIFLSLSLFTYSTADPPGSLVHPPAGRSLNACGKIGAWTAHWLLQLLGVGAHYLTISLGVLVSVLLSRKEINQPYLRAIGWSLSLVGVCSLAAMAFPGWSPGPVIGAGGYLGALGCGWLGLHFATAGSAVLVVAFIVVGWLLSTDYVLFKLSALALGAPARQVGRGLATVGKKYAGRPTSRKSDLGGFTTQTAAPAKGLRIKRRRTSDDIDDEIVDDAAPVVSKAAPDADDAHDDDLPELAIAGKTVQQEPAAALTVAEPEPAAVRVKPRGKQAEREQVIEELNAASATPDASEYVLPAMDLLLEGEPFAFEEQEQEVRRKAKVLEKTFANFGFKVKVVEIETGPVISQFEVELEAGLRLSKITSLADDLAIALRVPSVRIVAPIPGKNTVGIEVPNADRQLVRLREVIEELGAKAQKMRIPIFLGKDVAGNPLVADLASLPHLLIAGRTGTGKSVCLNTIIMSMLMTRRPDEVRMLLIDPKMVELSSYRTLPHLMHPVVTDMRKAEAILAWAVEKMEERYALLARAGVRHIAGYNQLGEEELMERLQPESDEEREQIPTNLPYIVIVADEMADLMMTAAKEVEAHIIRLAQKSRAVGIHLVLATQKPTVDVITGLIKSNLPARIAFQVASRVDSRVVLDEMGADKLLGNGDMLFLWPGTSTLLRGQGTYVSDDEINRVVECVGVTEPDFVAELVQLKAAAPTDGDPAERFKNRDELYESAVEIVIREGRGSVSLLQRGLGVGYGRAARLIDFMAEDGIVGQYNGSQAREVLLTLEAWQAMCGQAEPEPEPAKAAKKPSNRISLETKPKRTRRAAAPDPTPPFAYEEEAGEIDSVADEEDAPDEEIDDQIDDSQDDEDQAGAMDDGDVSDDEFNDELDSELDVAEQDEEDLEEERNSAPPAKRPRLHRSAFQGEE